MFDGQAEGPSQDEQLDEVVAAYLEAVEVGRMPDRRELVNCHPDLADALETFFADYDCFGHLAAPLLAISQTNPSVETAQAIGQPTAVGQRAGGQDALHPASAYWRIEKTSPYVLREKLADRRSAPELVTQPPTIAGYEILGILGRGGMGVVYKARQVALKRVVALKMMRAGEHADQEDLARFRTEADAVARLQHPHIVQIFEVGEQDGCPYFSLEFAEGGSLAKRLDGQPQAARQAADLVATLAVAMHAAHQHGIVHRDLKPANVLLAADGTPKITDFGLAKQLESDSGQTRTGAIVGTPSYMAPEQAAGRSKQIGPAADVYALGAILYELLTGRPPFRAATVLDTLDLVRHTEPVPPRQLQPKVPRDLETICLMCLRKEPGRRYASALALAEDFRRYLDGEPILARRAGVWERGLKYARRKPWVVGAWVAGLAAGLFLLAGAGHYLYRRNLDLESQLARQQALEDTRLRAAAPVSTAVDAMKKRNWPGVLAAANEAVALVGDEPALADLRQQAWRLRDAAETVVQFVDQRDQMTHHAVLAQEEGDQVRHRQAAQEAARKGLALFGLAGDGPVTLPHFTENSFTTETEQWITECCYEMYLTWAEILSSNAAATAGEQRAEAEKSLRMLDQAAQMGLTTKSYHQRRAEVLRLLCDEAGADQEKERAAALVPSRSLDHFLLGMELSRRGELEQAVAHLKKVQDHFWASYCLAGCYLRMRPQRFEKALAPLTTCIQLQPKFVWPYLLRGFVYGELRDFEAAFVDFDAAEKQPLDDVARYGLWVNRAAVRLRQGTDHEDRARGLRERGQSAEAGREVCLAMSCYDAVVADLHQAVVLRPRQPQAYANLAEVQLRRGRPETALSQLNRAIELAPSATLYRTRARLHEKQGAYAAALPDLDEAIRLAQGGRRQWELASDQMQRGRILFRLQKYSAALKAFDQTLAAAPDLVVAHQYRGETLLGLGRPTEAVEALDRYLAKGAPSTVASRARGLARAKLGNYAGAIEDYTFSLEIARVQGKAPDPVTLAYRGWAYLIQEAPKLALRDFDEALPRAASNRADCYAGRGYARVQLGQWRAAVSDVEAATKEGTPLPRTLYTAARIYAQAAAMVQIDPALRKQQVQELRPHYERRALELLRAACEKTPAAQRSAFWKEYVETEPALRPINLTADFSRMRTAFQGPVR